MGDKARRRTKDWNSVKIGKMVEKERTEEYKIFLSWQREWYERELYERRLEQEDAFIQARIKENERWDS